MDTTFDDPANQLHTNFPVSLSFRNRAGLKPRTREDINWSLGFSEMTSRNVIRHPHPAGCSADILRRFPERFNMCS